MLTPSHRLEGESLRNAPPVMGETVSRGYAAEAIGGLEYSPRRGCVANTAHNNHTGSRQTGPFCLMTAQTIPARRLPLLWIETENNCPAASGHRGQRWGKVEGRRFSAPPFSVSPQDNGKLKNISTHHFI